MVKKSDFLKNFIFLTIFFWSFVSVKAGLNNFTHLIFVEEWLIERKVDLTNDEIICRASIPSHANWFGARVRLDPNNELIKPTWINLKAEQLNDLKLAKVKKNLEDCRSGFFFIPNDL